ncbi:ERI1 exoribonuclease 3 [Trichogramma pretiosum]|uniref:ERI1 exoribonuclease 3 n=1 Tax=Trichogramma pretiosum TaxID=7493 RepID=UPI0006C96E42|nr:ERI1 exoribonuclease 3 [Trichogramma pretiosum]
MAHRLLRNLNKKIPTRIDQKVVQPFKNLLVLDFEATCIQNKILKPQEIIEFPCLVVSTEDWQVKDAFHEYVKPRVNPELSEFCTELTGIMQETIEDEENFPQVFEKFNQWLDEGEYFRDKTESTFVTCGNWDLKVMLRQQCELENIPVPEYMKEWIDIKRTFYAATNYYPRSLKDMLRHFNMEFQGRSHCGIDDTHNLVRIIQMLAIKHKASFVIPEKLEWDFSE